MKNTLIFGSIGTVMETSDIQRRAYNQALKEAGLTWSWTPEIYAELLKQSGGQERLAMLASATGTNLSTLHIDAIHARKTEIACQEMTASRCSLRPGVQELIEWALARGMKLAFVTTTYQPNIDAVFQTAGDALSKSDFTYIGSRSNVKEGKPSPEAYLVALQHLDVTPEHTVAIEDTAASVMSAKRAGLQVIATPGELSAEQDFWQADLVCRQMIDTSGNIDPHVLSMFEK